MVLSLEMALLPLSSANRTKRSPNSKKMHLFTQSDVQLSPIYRCNVLGAQPFYNFLSFLECVKTALWCDLSAYRPAQFEGWNPLWFNNGVVRFQFPEFRVPCYRGSLVASVSASSTLKDFWISDSSGDMK
jgi:hypothetical protein